MDLNRHRYSVRVYEQSRYPKPDEPVGIFPGVHRDGRWLQTILDGSSVPPVTVCSVFGNRQLVKPFHRHFQPILGAMKTKPVMSLKG